MKEATIHPTAIVHPGAQLGMGVTIGAVNRSVSGRRSGCGCVSQAYPVAPG